MRSVPVAAQPLEPWLAGLASDARPLVLLGGTGHLLLTPEEEAQAARLLEQAALPSLGSATAGAEVLILTGLAPGADLVFAEVASAWLARQGRPFRRVGLLPVPSEVLWGDWLTRAGTQAAARISAVRKRFERTLGTCDERVRLWDDDDAPDWSDLALRQRQYRKLAAVLAEQCDVMVAIMKPGHARQPGGTTEVVAWREHAAAVPAELSSGARRHRSGWPHGDRLLHVDPTAAGPAAAEEPWARNARDALREGNYLLCYDLAAKAEQQGHVSEDLQYVKLLALANAGSTETALRRFEEVRATLQDPGEDWLALEGRLHKDLGLRGGAAAVAHLRRAAECYAAAFRKTGGYFSAINAATTAMLAGDTAQARRLAQDVLAHVRRLAAGDETEQYYLRATEAEAALLLGDTAIARAALEAANRLLPDHVNARSRTLQQLRRVCRHGGVDERVLDALELPPVVYLPPLPAAGPAPAATATAAGAAFVYAGITHPRELEAVEAWIAAGARLHTVLASPREKMLAHWQDVHGAEWTLRLGRLLDHAHESSVALGFLDREDRWCDAYVGAMALGLSRLAARRLGSRWLGPDLQSRLDGAPGDIEETTTGVRFQRRFAGVIFADFAGFSRLRDTDLPPFWAHFMRAISERLAAHAPDILLKHTWGDALHVVTANARAAAQVACEIQSCLEGLRPALPGALAELELRLSAHYAPVFAGPDPVEGAGTYFGTQLSFTARIEPVTPPGMIFVTEAFAAQIALEAPEEFALEYAGEVKLAKAYGQSRLFSLRRTAG